MKPPLSRENTQTIVFRLTALWALSECGLGGVLHAIKFPFTGLIVGSIAIALITFILYFSESSWQAIANSLIIVLIIKLIISPHTSVTAYFAVSFQAIFSYLIYRLGGINGITILFTCLICFLETASQKIITLTIFGGFSFWKAINLFVDNVSQQLLGIEIENASGWLLMLYYGVYIIFTPIVAFFIYSLLDELSKMQLKNRESSFEDWIIKHRELRVTRKRSGISKVLLYSGIVLFVIITFIWLDENKTTTGFIWYYIFRSISIILLWYFVIMPGLMWFVRKYLNSKIPKYQAEVDEIISFFPMLKSIVYYTWDSTKELRSLKRLKQFFTLTIFELLSHK